MNLLQPLPKSRSQPSNYCMLGSAGARDARADLPSFGDAYLR